jgi:hypothetical protein
MDDQLYSFLQSLPLLLGIGTLYYFARKAMKKETEEFKAEEERKAKLRALSPPPSYEERMGVQYGPTGTQVKESHNE